LCTLLQLASSLAKDWEAKLASAAEESRQQVAAAEDKLHASMDALSAMQHSAGRYRCLLLAP
jgi:predicted ATP-dependent serine protease